MAAGIGTRGDRGLWQRCPGGIRLACPLAGVLLALARVLRRPPARTAGQTAPGGGPAGPRPARVVVTDAQVEAARMIVEHDRAAGRETATAIRKIAEAIPAPRQNSRASRRR